MNNKKKQILLISLNIENEYSLALHYLKLFILNQKKLKELINIDILEYEISVRQKDVALEILDKKPDLVGFSCNIWNIEQTLNTAKIIKTFINVPIILGGQEVTNSYIDYLTLNPFIDILVNGEGEITFLELVRDFINSNLKNLDKINGIEYRKKNKIYKNSFRLPIENLDIIPSPYLNNSIQLSDNLHLGAMIELTRGCPHKCSFCFEADNFKKTRSFSLERVKDELNKLYHQKDIKKFHFLDPILACANINRLKELNKILKSIFKGNKDYFIPVEVYAEFINENNIEFLNEFSAFDIGLQTTNKTVHNNIHRNFNLEKFEKGFYLLKSLNKETVIYLILGLPGDSFFSFIKSIQYVISIKPTFFHLNYLYVLNGIPMRKDIEKYQIQFNPKPPYDIISNNTFSQKELKIAKLLSEVTTKQYNLNYNLFQHKMVNN